MLIVQLLLGVAQIGLSSEQVHCSTQVPMPFSSTPQHIAPLTHESTPLTPPPSAMQGAPIGSGLAATGTHLVAFQLLPPLLAQALHFSPGPQSSPKMSHSTAPPASGSMMKPPLLANTASGSSMSLPGPVAGCRLWVTGRLAKRGTKGLGWPPLHSRGGTGSGTQTGTSPLVMVEVASEVGRVALVVSPLVGPLVGGGVVVAVGSPVGSAVDWVADPPLVVLPPRPELASWVVLVASAVVSWPLPPHAASVSARARELRSERVGMGRRYQRGRRGSTNRARTSRGPEASSTR